MKKKSGKPTTQSTSVQAPDDKPVLDFASAGDFEAWLTIHHADHGGLWIHFYKATSGVPSLTYAEALDVALCFGWIDGPVRSATEISWIHKFTPRGKRSVWSQINKGHIERLGRDGRLRPAGLAAVESAKADGRWDAAYASASTFQESPEFLQALKRSKKASKFYATLSRSKQYSFYYRLHTAKRPETKTRKIAEFVAMLERGETFN